MQSSLKLCCGGKLQLSDRLFVPSSTLAWRGEPRPSDFFAPPWTSTFPALIILRSSACTSWTGDLASVLALYLFSSAVSLTLAGDRVDLLAESGRRFLKRVSGTRQQGGHVVVSPENSSDSRWATSSSRWCTAPKWCSRSSFHENAPRHTGHIIIPYVQPNQTKPNVQARINHTWKKTPFLLKSPTRWVLFIVLFIVFGVKSGFFEMAQFNGFGDFMSF